MEPVDPKTRTQEASDPTSTAKTVQLATAAKHPMTGQVLGTYEIQDVLGKGGMGVVFRARDAALDRNVALKVLAPELAGDEAYVERFLREAKAAAKLDHPNVVQVFAAGQQQSHCWMAMQYAKGVPLSQLLRKGRKFTVQESLQVVRQVALALGAAHKAEIIHRDIKPSNIMLDEAGRALVMDFGLSRGIATGERITRTGTYLGTPEYSSPEQCETNDLDGRSDLYSLGVVFYEMLTGRVPHVAETPLALFKKIAEERPTPVTAINKQVPTSVQAILDRMLAKDREHRYASAEDVVRDIDRALGGQSVSAPRAGSPGKRLGWLAAVASVLLAAGVAVWKWPSDTAPQPAPPVNGGGGSSVVPPELLGTRVVVLDFKDLKGAKETAWMEVGIPELLLGQLDALLSGNVVSREELLETMAQVVGKKVNTGEGDARLALGKELAAVVARVQGRVVVTGTYVVNGEDIRITANVYERKPGMELLRRDTCVVNGSVNDVFGLVDQLAASLAPHARRELAPPSAPASLPAASAPPKMGAGELGEGAKSGVRQSSEQPVIQVMIGKAADGFAQNKEAQRILGLIAGLRKDRGSREGGVKAPGGPSPEEPSQGDDGEELGSPKDAQDECLAAGDRLARTRRFFENLRACEEMDLKQQKALRNDLEFLESLCEEECADTLKQKYQTWCESNQAPKQEAAPAK